MRLLRKIRRVTTLIKQDIIKARKKLTAEEALDRGYRFARTYKAIREALTDMVNGEREVMKNNISIKIPEYTICRLESLGITVRDFAFKVLFRLERL